MDPRLDEILRAISPAGAAALRELVQLHVRAAMTRGYHPSTSAFSTKLKKLLADVPASDLGILVLRLSEGDGSVRAFFEAEGERRRKTIADWVFRGILPDHTPDIVTITFVREPIPKTPVADEMKP